MTPPHDVPSFVQRKLVRLSKERHTDPNHLFLQYAFERFLYRLSISDHADTFVLKGAMLFSAWTGSEHRTTRDLDFLAYGARQAQMTLRSVWAICAV